MARVRIDSETLRDTSDIKKSDVLASKQIIVQRKKALKEKIDERFQPRLDRLNALLAEFDVV